MEEKLYLCSSKMRRFANITIAIIALVLMLLSTSGIMVERCSCTGNISLALPSADACCGDESDCMTQVSLQLPECLPVAVTHVEAPQQTLSFVGIPSFMHVPFLSRWIETVDVRAGAPPGALVHKVEVLRV